MLEIIKVSERKMKASEYFSVFRKCGWKTNHLGEYDKWKDLSDGGRLQVKINVYEIIDNNEKKSYAMVDTLGRIMNPFVLDKEEIYNWLKEKGYKPDKQWYMEDFGMSEELWEEWNK